MKQIEINTNKDEFFAYRESVLKKKRMRILESQIFAFLKERNIKFHRQYPLILGNKGNGRRKWYAVSFFLPEHKLMLDMVDDKYDKMLYESYRCRRIPFHPTLHVDKIMPIKRSMMWVDVEKMLIKLLNL